MRSPFLITPPSNTDWVNLCKFLRRQGAALMRHFSSGWFVPKWRRRTPWLRSTMSNLGWRHSIWFRIWRAQATYVPHRYRIMSIERSSNQFLKSALARCRFLARSNHSWLHVERRWSKRAATQGIPVRVRIPTISRYGPRERRRRHGTEENVWDATVLPTEGKPMISNRTRAIAAISTQLITVWGIY